MQTSSEYSSDLDGSCEDFNFARTSTLLDPCSRAAVASHIHRYASKIAGLCHQEILRPELTGHHFCKLDYL